MNRAFNTKSNCTQTENALHGKYTRTWKMKKFFVCFFRIENEWFLWWMHSSNRNKTNENNTRLKNSNKQKIPMKKQQTIEKSREWKDSSTHTENKLITIMMTTTNSKWMKIYVFHGKMFVFGRFSIFFDSFLQLYTYFIIFFYSERFPFACLDNYSFFAWFFVPFRRARLFGLSAWANDACLVFI